MTSVVAVTFEVVTGGTSYACPGGLEVLSEAYLRAAQAVIMSDCTCSLHGRSSQVT